MALPTFTHSGVSYAAQPAGTTTFALTTSGGKAINYLLPSHIHVYSTVDNGTTLVELTRPAQWGFNAAGTSVVLTSGIAAGTAIILQRITSSDGPYTTFGQGTLLTADQLNDATLFNLYTSQETEDEAGSATAAALLATTAATAATTAANTATSTANTALSTANAASATAATSLSNSQTALTNSQTAVSNSASAVSTSQTAAANAATALTTSQTASTNAAAAVSTANTASTNASTALSTANTSLANSQTASQNASTALTNSQTSLTQSASAVTTANNSSTVATNASTVATAAAASAASATTTANNANSKADQAIAAVSSSINYTLIANVAAIPASPSNNTYIEVSDSTGIESFTPLTGRPAGFVGDSGLTVRLVYTTAGTTWNWLSYFPSNAETRYLKLTGGSLTGAVTTTGTSTAASFIPTSSTAPSNGLYLSSTNTVALATASTGRLFVDASGRVSVAPSTALSTFSYASGDRTPRLQVLGSSLDEGSFSVTRLASAPSIFLGNGSSGFNTDANATLGRLVFAGFQTDKHYAGAEIQALAAGTPSQTSMPASLIFNVTPASSVTPVERLRLTSDGRLGLGTSAPFTTIHSAKSVTGGSPATSGTTDANVIARFQGGSVGFDLGATASGPQWIQPRNVNDFSANYGLSLCPNGGNVGIGVVGPSQKLRVVGDSGSAQFGAGTAGNGVFVNAFDSDTIYMTASATNATQFGIGAASNIPLFFMTNNTERARITSDGKLGLGTSSPQTSLHVVGTNNAECARIDGNSGASDRNLVFSNSGNSIRWLINSQGGSTGAGELGLQTNSTTRLLIDSSGRVGIGTAVASQLLHVAGFARIGANDASDAQLEIGAGATGNRNAYIDLVGDTTYTDYALRIIRVAGGPNALSQIAHRGTGDFSIVTNEAASITFNTNNLERGRWDSNGRFLVGTSSASAADATVIVQGNAQSSAFGSRLYLSRGEATPADGAGLGHLNFSDSTHSISAMIRALRDGGTWSASSKPGRLEFSTTADGASSPTERMRITSGGTVMVNTTSADPVGASVSQSCAFGPGASDGAFSYYNASAQCLKLGRGNNGDIITFFRNQPSATVVGSVSVTTTATAYNTSSDYRLKENVVPLTGAIDRLNDLRVHRFNFIADPDKTVDGFIAHEAQEIVPECVTGTKDEVDEDGTPIYQGIDQSKLVPLLTAALQEALQKIEDLESRLTAAGL